MNAKRRLAGSILAGFIVAWVPAARAAAPGGSDGAGPIPLFPPSETQPEPPTAPGPAPREIEIQPLAAPAADSIGLLTPASGGFPATLWAGSSAEHIAQLLAALPVPSDSAAAEDLQWKALVSQAPAPSGTANGSSLLALRLQRLYDGGQIEAVSLLLDRAGKAGLGPELARLRAEIALFEADPDRACTIAEAMRKRAGESWWLRLSAFCAARKGDGGAAQLNLDLLNEAEHGVDPAFSALIAAILSDKAEQKEAGGKPPKIEPPKAASFSMLDVALYRAAKVPVPEAILVGADIPALRALAADDQTEPQLRIRAAERAAAVGAVKTEQLGAIYASATFTDEQLATAKASAAKLSEPLGNALLFQTIRKTADAGAKLELLRAALGRMGAQHMFLLAARLYAAELAAPDPDRLAAARPVAEALLAGGRPDQAFAWYLLAQQAAQSGKAEAAAAAADLWPVFALSLSPDRFPVEPRETLDWARSSKLEPAAKQRLLMLLEAAGRPVSVDAWWTVIEDPAARPPNAVNPAFLRLAESSAQQKRLGETVLEALILYGAEPLRDANPDALAHAVSALRAVGLEEAARGLARDAAIAAAH